MRLLAFDTSGAAISAAAGQDGVLLSARREPLTRGHAERLLPLLQEVLAEVGWTWRDIELVVVSEGPGNFTGVRAGIAVARGLALALDCAVLGIGTLELVAEAGAAAAPDNRLPIQALLDARRGEVYSQLFASDRSPLTPPRLATPASVMANLASPCLLVGDAAAGMACRAARDDRVIETDLDARYLLRAGWLRLADGAEIGPGTALRPVYLRQPDARLGAGASILRSRA